MQAHMHLAWNDRRTRQFITNVGLITSNGPAGPDIMVLWHNTEYQFGTFILGHHLYPFEWSRRLFLPDPPPYLARISCK